MKRIRLDIGALAASPQDGGSFMFFLYREGMDRCLPVSLTPPQMHAVLSNFKVDSTDISLHGAFSRIMQQYRIELLEVSIVRDDNIPDEELLMEQGPEKRVVGGFLAELLLFDGESEVRELVDFIDGVILSKQFGAPIYIAEELMDKYAKSIDTYSRDVLDGEALLKKLKEELQSAINNEEYERAAEISKRIEKLQKGK